MNDKYESLSEEQLENVSGGEFGATEHTVEINDRNFNAFIRSAVNVVVLFGVCWSGTCETACSIIERLAAKHKNVRAGIFEVTNSEYLRYKLGIKNYPTTIRYKGGTEEERIEGAKMLTRLF